jgi:hypothetical protein
MKLWKDSSRLTKLTVCEALAYPYDGVLMIWIVVIHCMCLPISGGGLTKMQPRQNDGLMSLKR